jgi:hypothetical protein
MNTQTLLAILIVLVCIVLVMRSWISFWIELIRNRTSPTSTGSGCAGCAMGCRKQAVGPQIVELKQEKRHAVN